MHLERRHMCSFEIPFLNLHFMHPLLLYICATIVTCKSFEGVLIIINFKLHQIKCAKKAMKMVKRPWKWQEEKHIIWFDNNWNKRTVPFDDWFIQIAKSFYVGTFSWYANTIYIPVISTSKTNICLQLPRRFPPIIGKEMTFNNLIMLPRHK